VVGGSQKSEISIASLRSAFRGYAEVKLGILFERGIDICHEKVRYWWNRFGPMYPAEIRKRRVSCQSYSNWLWHLYEVFILMNGEIHCLWRAIDHEGEALEVFALNAEMNQGWFFAPENRLTT
jgi:transposase-like protein